MNPGRHRIVSLIPSATEIVAALGHSESLVGRSHECDFPNSVRSLPICSEARIEVSASSIEIDRQVKASLANALSIYRVYADVIAELQPTMILTQSLCDVCAVSLQDVESVLCEFVGSRPRLVSLSPMSLSDVWADIQRVADALGDPESGHRLVKSLQQRLSNLTMKVAGQPPPTVACIEWLEPLMSAGNWVPELIEIAGGRPLLSTSGRHSPWLAWDDLLQADPDKIVVMPCGFDLPRLKQELSALINHPLWPTLRAVEHGEVFLTDGNQFFNRPGPRLVESTEIIAEILFPKVVPGKNEHRGWERLGCEG